MNAFQKIKAIAKREFFAYFNSALAYVFLTIFIVLGTLMTFNLGSWFATNEASLRIFFKFHPYIYLAFVPALGMRVWAEEENEGTLELLLTMPISVWHAVVGKFLAGWAFIGFALLLTFPMLITVCTLGDPDPGRLFSGYLGSFLAGGMFFALTSLTSAFTKNQVISFIFGFTVLITIVVVGMPQLGLVSYLRSWIPSGMMSLIPVNLIETISFFSILPHYEGLEKGVLDLRDILYFLSFIIFSLLCSTTILRFRKAAHKNNSRMSYAGIAVFSIILLLVNYLSRDINVRYDLSADRLYTLTDSTKSILRRIDGPVSVRFYYSRSDSSLSIERKAFALRIEDLLKEYSALTNNQIGYKILDPKPESVEETSAVLDGIEPIIKADKTKGYFGLSVSYRDNINTIPVLDESTEQMLEYHLTNIFKHLLRPKRPIIGILTDYPISGQKANPMAGQYQDKPAWAIIESLRQDYELRIIGEHPSWGAAGKNYFDLVIIFKFSQMAEASRAALDQHLLRGGKAIIFTDSFPVHASQVDKSFRFQPNRLPYRGVTLGMIESWKISLRHNAFIVDEKYSTQIKQGESVSTLSLTGDSLNRSHPALASLEKVILPYAGYFRYKKTPGIEITELITSSPDAYLVDTRNFGKLSMIHKQRQKTVQKKSPGAPYPIVLQVKGKLPSFYRGRSFPEQGTVLKEAVAESEVILIGDIDMLEDSYSVTPIKEFGRTRREKISDNQEFILNLVDSLVTNGETISIRMRKEKKRKLTYLITARENLREEFSEEFKTLRQDYDKYDAVIQESHRRQENQIVLTNDELTKLRDAEEGIQKVSDRSNAIQDQFNQMENEIKMRITFYNATSIPLLIVVFGFLVGFYRKRRRAST